LQIGMIFETKRHPITASVLEQAMRQLSRADPALAELIRRVGPCELGMRRRGRYFPALVEAIIYQQLTAKAAGTILARFRALYGTGRFPTPAQVAATSAQTLRTAGLSSQKISYLHDLAGRFANGSSPLRRISAMDDEEVIRRLTEIKGIGRWTAEMFLIFTLGRPDVFPATDLGIRKAVQRLYGHAALLPPLELAELAERWMPHRSVASWYLWASVDGKAPDPDE
jgi:3-methyladenine DNA glycosylase/8-oxoguanine DNA glycosylase